MNYILLFNFSYFLMKWYFKDIFYYCNKRFIGIYCYLSIIVILKYCKDKIIEKLYKIVVFQDEFINVKLLMYNV